MLDLCGFKGLLLLFRLSASYLIYFAPLPSGEKNKPAYTALITTAFSYLGVLLVSPFKSMVVDFFLALFSLLHTILDIGHWVDELNTE